MNNCCAIFVTYNPNWTVLQKAISATVSQVDRIYIIDNGSRESFANILGQIEGVEGVFLLENRGIAAGFNIGIQLARKAGYKYLLLFDQDSIPPEGMVSRYLDVVGDLLESGENFAAIGPRYRNPQTGHKSRFVRLSWFHNSYHGDKDGTSVVPADFLISSGSFYDVTVFEKVGMFDEGLFIDHVDTEWFLRARSLGFQSFGVCDVVMEHSLGESAMRLWFLRWHVQPMHKPFRLYYIFRNSLLIYCMPHSSKKWISGDIVRTLRLILMYIIFSPQRYEALNWMKRGFRDGIRRVSGPAPLN